MPPVPSSPLTGIDRNMLASPYTPLEPSPTQRGCPGELCLSHLGAQGPAERLKTALPWPWVPAVDSPSQPTLPTRRHWRPNSSNSSSDTKALRDQLQTPFHPRPASQKPKFPEHSSLEMAYTVLFLHLCSHGTPSLL